MKLTIKLLPLIAFAAMLPAANAASVIVTFDSFATSVAPNQNFANTLSVGGLTSGVTTVTEGESLGILPQGATGGGDNGRFTGGSAGWGDVTYSFASAQDQIGGLMFWNYNEFFGGELFNERGITGADLTITHSGGTTDINGVSFTLTPETTVPAAEQLSLGQYIDFGQVFNGVTSIELSNLAGDDVNFAGWEAAAAVAVPEPSSTALIGLAGMSLLLRRRK